MNISVKSQTVPKKSGKGLTNYFKTRKKAKIFCCISIPLSWKKAQIVWIPLETFCGLRLNTAWSCTGVHCWHFSDFSWYMRLHTLGTMMLKFSEWFLAVFFTHTKVFSNSNSRIYNQNHKRLSTFSMSLLHFDHRPVCQPWIFIIQYLQHTAQCTHFQWLRQKMYFKSHFLQYNVDVSLRQHLLQTFCKSIAMKNGIINIFLQTNIFQCKRAKRPNESFKVNHLKQG